MSDKARLEAKVKAVNAVHAYAVNLCGLLRPVFEPLVGTEVLKADGGLLKKVQKLLPEFPKHPRILVYLNGDTRYSLKWGVKADEQVEGQPYCTYYEISVYIADISGLKVEKLYDPVTYRSDYTADEVEGKRAVYKELQKQADNAKSALWPFGENDRN